MEIGYKSMKSRFIFITSLLLISLSHQIVHSQVKVYLAKGQSMKKVDGMYGISASGKWIIPAEYNSIEAQDYNYIIARKSHLVDLYKNTTDKKLVAKDLTPSQANIFLAFLCCKSGVGFANGKWTFIPEFQTDYQSEEYDSIWPVNSGLFMPFVKAYQNGMIQILGSQGDKFGSLNTYKSFDMIDINPPIQYGGISYSFVVKGVRQNGEIEYFENKHKQLPVEIFDNDPSTVVHDWWQELKIFRNEKGLMGILDYNNKTKVPPILKSILMFSMEITAKDGHGFQFSGMTHPPEINTDTFVLGEKYHFITHDEMSLIIYPGGNSGGLSMTFNQKFDHTMPILYDVHCIACVNGIITSRKTSVEVVVLEEGYSYDIKSKVVWAELNQFGKFPTGVTSNIVIPPKIQKIITTEENSYVCDQCFGYIDYTEGLQWNESLQEYQVFFMPHKMKK